MYEISPFGPAQRHARWFVCGCVSRLGPSRLEPSTNGFLRRLEPAPTLFVCLRSTTTCRLAAKGSCSARAARKLSGKMSGSDSSCTDLAAKQAKPSPCFASGHICSTYKLPWAASAGSASRAKALRPEKLCGSFAKQQGLDAQSKFNEGWS